MKTLPDTHVREVSCCPTPVTIWQTLLTRLLDQHYSLTLNDTPFVDERVIEQHIEAGAYFHERRSLNNFHRDRVITFEQIAE